jgi:hypothetical protein
MRCFICLDELPGWPHDDSVPMTYTEPPLVLCRTCYGQWEKLRAARKCPDLAEPIIREFYGDRERV